MKGNRLMLFLKGCIIILMSCHGSMAQKDNPYANIDAIPPPAGYHRETDVNNPFGGWLRRLPLKKDRTVYLYDGSPKKNQAAQFAVLDISVGDKDLQQCADAVMRLRAEFLYARKDYAHIEFRTGQGTRLNFREWSGGRKFRLVAGRLSAYQVARGGAFCVSRDCLADYLDAVFSYCGTLSLERQYMPVNRMAEIQAGDVLIKGGSPGHAMLVVDAAVDGKGNKVFLLAQSYMPAQDIHVVKNPSEPGLSPWYRVDDHAAIVTPEWIFYPWQLHGWLDRDSARLRN